VREEGRIHVIHGGWHLGLWDVLGLAAVVVVASSSWSFASFNQEDGWYQLTSFLPGERVPAWLHTGRMYRGVPVPRDNVRIFAPDSDASVVISTSLLRQVAAPLKGQA
jgi:hypothetical protein